MLPSSHSSPVSKDPFPQKGSSSQILLQPSPSKILLSSHSSPASVVPLPHTEPVSIKQFSSQPSPATVFPSSQASFPSTALLPHTGPTPTQASVQILFLCRLPEIVSR